jgi:hypothetical protein
MQCNTCPLPFQPIVFLLTCHKVTSTELIKVKVTIESTLVYYIFMWFLTLRLPNTYITVHCSYSQSSQLVVTFQFQPLIFALVSIQFQWIQELTS